MKAFIVGALFIMAGLVGADAAAAVAQKTPTTNGYSVRQITIPSQSSNVSTAAYDYPTSGNGSSTQTISDTTSNWAGYISSGGTYTGISGSWKVPSVSASSETFAADAAWIGIGGESSNDLIQVGTQNIVENGQVAAGSFYEQLPDSSITIPGVSVSAGDSITASVREVSDGEWTIYIKDITNGQSFSNTVAYDSSKSSAEWIQEAPSDGSGIIPLDQFGSVTFTDGSTTVNGSTVDMQNSGAKAINMINDYGQAMTAISAISNNGFTVSRTSASNADSYGQYVTIPSGSWRRYEPGLDGYSGQGYSSNDPSGYSQPTSDYPSSGYSWWEY
ncbi:MAG TPA: G1 family glutamic endopeptidase [Candidatus Saccharimonadales bacterium]|nr:G1 family glutamic endopeptidase [Candidatus Saccharimonadales bacterium]